MNTLKSLFADSFQGFLPADIPFFLLQLFTSALVTLILIKIYKFKNNDVQPIDNNILPLSLIMVLLVAISKNIPLLGLFIIALSILLNPFKLVNDKTQITYLILCLGFSIAIGTGNILFSLIALPIVMLFLLLNKK
jgi:hypothetical protein